MISSLSGRSSLHILFLLIILFFLAIPLKSQNRGSVIEYNTLITVQGNSLIEEKSFIIQVDDKQSDWLSDIRIGYNKYSKPDIVEAMVISNTGAVLRKLGRKEIVTRSDISDGSLYEDDYVMEFSLRWNEYPYRIKYTYRKTTDRFIYLTVWSPHVFPGIPTRNANLKIIFPLNYNYRILSSGNLIFKKDSVDKTKVLTWQASDIYPVARERFAPPYQDLLPSVYVIPLSFNYGMPGTLESWGTFGTWHSGVNRDLLALPSSEKQKVDELISGAADRKEIVRRLYHYMQDNTRYINVSIDVGGLIPYPASYVCTNRYGDCKALTIYMMALLRYAGVESYYSLVWAGDNPVTIKKEFPAPQFNHVILCVPSGNDTIWLENTSSLLPFGYLGTFTQNRYALVVNADKSRLVRIPALSYDDVLVRSVFVIDAELSGNARMSLKRQIRGVEFEEYLPVLTDLTKEEQKTIIGNEIALKNQVLKCDFLHSDRDARALSIEADMRVETVFRKIGNSLVFNFSPGSLLALEKPADRKLPVKINYPVNHVDSIIIKIPFYGQVDIKIPEDTTISSEYGFYSVKYKLSPGEIVMFQQFALSGKYYTADKYEGLYEFFESIRLLMKKSAIILNRKI